MDYQQNYAQNQYAGYSGYGQTPQANMYQANQAQTQYQHPMVVIPAQRPRRDVSQFSTSPHLSHPQYSSELYQQASQFQQPGSPYYTTPQQWSPHSQAQQLNGLFDNLQQPVQYDQQSVVRENPVAYQQQPSFQAPHQQSSSQSQHHRHVRQAPPQVSPELLYQPSPRQFVQVSPLLNQQPQGLPVQESSQQFSHPQVVVPQALQRSQAQTQYHTPPTQVQDRQFERQSVPQQQPARPRPQQRSNQQPHAPSSPDPLQLDHSRSQQQHRTPSSSGSSRQQRPQARVESHVEIPGQRSVVKPVEYRMPQPPKRRRTNEGNAIPVCDAPAPQRRQSSQQQRQAPVSSSPLTELASSQLPPPPTPQPSVDYQSVLLGLSDEYVNAAYSLSSPIANGHALDEQHQEYNNLMSTAMGCLESVLNNYRQSDPRKEARIRLRLASLLIEETENDQKAEEVLSSGIALCDRSRLVDLKYAMHHLSVRLVFRRSPKAASKSLDKLIQEVETLRLLNWMYAFRFLRVTLSLRRSSHSEYAAAVKSLNALANLADGQRHISVQIVAAALEAMVHLRSETSDATDLSLRAMSAARSHQLGPEMQRMPQIKGLMDCLDLMCSLAQYSHDQVAAKMQQMQNNLDAGTRNSGWNKDGSFGVELGPSENEELAKDTSGIMRRNKDGEAVLVLCWITNTQLYTLGFLLSGLASLQQNRNDVKAEEFLDEGIKLSDHSPSAVRESFSAADTKLEQQRSFGVALRLYRTFAYCGRYEWDMASTEIRDVRKAFSNYGTAMSEPINRLLLYLEALCNHGRGELGRALEVYGSPLLIFEPDNKAGSIEKDIRALATLNSIFILRTLGVEEYVKADNLLAAVESYCLNHLSKAFLAVYHIVKATSQGSHGTIIKTKQYIQIAVQASRATSNNQLLLCVVMNLMTENFFHHTIVGDQAEKAANAGRSLAAKSRNKLWTVVADDMYSDIMERCGKTAEAETARKEAQRLLPDLPEPLRKQLGEES